MSLPTFPTTSLTTTDSLNMILASVAMEELALSHIINAEGEKLQYILNALKHDKDCVQDIIAVNKNIKFLLDSVSQNQQILKEKMEYAIDALKNCKPKESCCQIVYKSRPDECLYHGRAIKWMQQGTPSGDCEKIRLHGNKSYSVGFTVDLCSQDKDCNLAIGLQKSGCRQTDVFVYHAPLSEGKLITAAANAIPVKACGCCPTDLMLTLLSPTAILIHHAFISITELTFPA